MIPPAGSTNPKKQNRVRSVKLDFGPLIATFQVALPAPFRTPSPPPPAWPSGFPISSRRRVLSAQALRDYGEHFFSPTVRLGVTGLSRAGKTVFITALVHGLTRGGRFPVFEPFATGRHRPRPARAAARRRGAALRLREPCAHPDRGAALAELDGRHQRTAPRHRLPAAERRGAHADARHRRLSRRMAARPAAAAQEL